MQPVTFATIDDFLAYLPDPERKIVDFLRNLVLDCIPGVTEKLAYNVPYYYRHSRIAFIWPASVPWGSVKLTGVQLGFCQGNLLQDPINYLEKGNRKQVYTKTFTRVEELAVDLIKMYLFEAVQVDEQIRKIRQHGK